MSIDYDARVRELVKHVHICETSEDIQKLRDHVKRYANATLPNTLNSKILGVLINQLVYALLLEDELKKNEQIDKIKTGLSTIQYLISRGLINPDYYILHPVSNSCSESNNYYNSVMPQKFCTCKNILLRDNSGNIFLVVVPFEKRINIKDLRRNLKEIFSDCGKLQFVSEEEMKRLLNVGNGDLSLFSLIFDQNNQVITVLDDDLPKDTLMAFHPNYNRLSLFIFHNSDKAEDDISFFLRSIGKRSITLKVPEEIKINDENINREKIL